MTKQGRPRKYDFAARAKTEYAGFASSDLAIRAAHLRELRERVRDQIVDLDLEAIRCSVPGTSLSIEWLAAHLVWSEVGWMRRITTPPDAVRGAVFEPETGWAGTMAYQDDPDTSARATVSTARLVELIDLVETDVTVPTLRTIPGPETQTGDARLATCGDVLTHLVWHWTYHSGQIGLVRLMCSSDYEWRFD